MCDGTDDAPEHIQFEQAADALFSAVLTIEDVDLNALRDDDVLTLLESKQTLEDMTRRYRRDQHAARRRASDERGGGR